MKQRNDVSRAAGDKLNLSDRIKDGNPVQNPVRPRTEDGGQSESETHEFAFNDQDNKDKGSCLHPESPRIYDRLLPTDSSYRITNSAFDFEN